MLTRICVAMLLASEVVAGQIFDDRGGDRPRIAPDWPPEVDVDRNEVWIRPTVPGTSIPDWNRPGYLLQEEGSMGTRVCQTYPGTSICDYRAPGFIIQ